MRIGSDTGGTFTDLVDERGRVAKVLSTPEDPTEAVRAGIAALRVRRVDLLAHGTTVATNALLEGELAPTALVSTEGFADVIEIARQDRPRSMTSGPTDRRPWWSGPGAWRWRAGSRPTDRSWSRSARSPRSRRGPPPSPSASCMPT